MCHRSRGVVVVLWASASMGGEPCDQPVWTAGTFGFPGPDGTVATMVTFDDGTGQALYAGGLFNFAAGLPARGIARWNGREWGMVGDGFGLADMDHTNAVRSLQVFDDGMGPVLYAGGFFETSFGAPVDFVARWDGRRWQRVGEGLNGMVRDMCVLDDGSGRRLIAVGSMSFGGVTPTSGIAQWDGTTWSSLGHHPIGPAFAVVPFAVNGAERPVVAGGFDQIGGVTVNHIGYFDGEEWNSLGRGVNDTVYDLVVHDDGSGTAIYAGGRFTMSGQTPCSHVARWTQDGGWVEVGEGLNGDVWSLVAGDLGDGPELIASGQFHFGVPDPHGRIARWDGNAWHAVESVSGTLLASARFAAAGEPRTYLGGNPLKIDDSGDPLGIIQWNGAEGRAVGGGASLPGAYSDFLPPVFAATGFDDGNGAKLFVGGAHLRPGGATEPGVLLRWDFDGWTTIPVPPDLALSVARATRSFDGGTGAALYVGGEPSPFASSGISRWNGSDLAPVGAGLDGAVRALAIFDFGNGPQLVAGGGFTESGNTSVKRVARWDGTAWRAVGDGIPDGASGDVSALAVFNDGSGDALYAGTEYDAALFRWNGEQWMDVTPTSEWDLKTTEAVRSLFVHDTGGGATLYVGLQFEFGATARLWRWNGTSWSVMPGAFTGSTSFFGPTVRTMESIHFGPLAGLYVGGTFTHVDGAPVNRVARWDGVRWSAVDHGFRCHSAGADDSSVAMLTRFDDGSGEQLFAGGNFACAGGYESVGLARLGCSLYQPVHGDLDHDRDVDLVDAAKLVDCWGSLVHPENACAEADLDITGKVELGDLAAMQRAFHPW